MKKLLVVVSVVLVFALLLGCAPAKTTIEPVPAGEVQKGEIVKPGEPAPTPAPKPTPAPTPAPKPTPEPELTGLEGLTYQPALGGKPNYGGILNFDVPADAAGFDLHLRPYRSPTPMVPIFNNLLRLDINYFEAVNAAIIGDLAKTWEVSDDKMTFTFHLERGVTWHDGMPFTADDVVYSMEKIMDPERSTTGKFFPSFESIKKVDDYTVIIQLKFPTATFLLRLCMERAVMQAKHLAGTDSKSTDFIVGTGPFMFKSYKEGVAFESQRNPNYFRFDPDYPENRLPYLDGMIIHIMKGTAVNDALVAGRTDFRRTPIQDQETKEQIEAQNPNLSWLRGRNKAPYMIFMNSKFEPFKDVRVRRAFGLVMRQEDQIIARSGAIPWGDLGRGFFHVSWGLPKEEIAEIMGWNQPYEARVAEAQKLMKEAGYANGFKLEMVSAQSGRQRSIVDHIALADKLTKYLNIECELLDLPTAQALERQVSGDFGTYAVVKSVYFGDPDDNSALYATGGANNIGSYSNPEVDKLFDLAAREMDFAKRLALANEIERILLVDLPALPTGNFPANFFVVNPWLKNFRRVALSKGTHDKREYYFFDPIQER